MQAQSWSRGWQPESNNITHPDYGFQQYNNNNNSGATRDRISVLEAQLRLARISLQNEPTSTATSRTTGIGGIQYVQLRRDRLNRIVNALETELQEALESLHNGNTRHSTTNDFDDGREPWTWRGRPIAQVARVPKVQPGISGGRVENLASRLMERAKEVESKVSRMETLMGVGSNRVESQRKKQRDIQQKLRRGEQLGQERANAKAQAKKKLEASAFQLRRQIVQQSAMSVQSMFRGHLGRKKMKSARAKYDQEMRQTQACVAQSHVRGLLARRHVGQVRARLRREKEESAAIVIQNQTRGSLARKQLRSAKSQKERRNAAATMIQAWFRGCVGRRRILGARELFRRDISNAAAVMLQSAWRRVVARKKAEGIKGEFDSAMEEAAAIMLQAAWRGHQARKNVKVLRKEKEQTEDKLMEMEWADRVKKQYVAKFFLGVKERAALRVQNVVRSFLARRELNKRRISRERQDQEEAEVEKERKRRRQAAERARLEAAKVAAAEAQAEEAKKQFKLATLERHDDGRVVYQGEMVMPVKLLGDNEDLMGPEESGLGVQVTVQEVSKPTYQLRFGIYERKSKTVFRKEIDAAMLEELLEPLFNARGFTATMDAKPVERAMFNWMATGKPPERKYVIAWLLDRMWFDGSSSSFVGDYELCLGSRPAQFDRTLHRTLNAALVDGASRLKYQAELHNHNDEENIQHNDSIEGERRGGGGVGSKANVRGHRNRQLSDVLDAPSDDDESWLGLSPSRAHGGRQDVFEAKSPNVVGAGGGDQEYDEVFEGNMNTENVSKHATPTPGKKGAKTKKPAGARNKRGGVLRRQLPFFRVQRASNNHSESNQPPNK